jgi:hypothetical protein
MNIGNGNKLAGEESVYRRERLLVFISLCVYGLFNNTVNSEVKLEY